MPGRELKEYLDARHVRYESFRHAPAYTAQEVAQRIHIHGWDFAKAVMVRAGGRLILVVVPAPLRIDLARLCRACGGARVELIAESELSELFPDSEVGAMSPFGNLYGLPVIVDRRLAERARIVFNAGSHAEALRIAYADFKRLVEPTVADVVSQLEVSHGVDQPSA